MPNTAEESRSDLRFSWFLFAVITTIVVILAWPFLTSRMYMYDDLWALHVPMRYFYWKALAAGDSFLWVPNVFCGHYLQGEGEIGMCHPLHWIFYSTLPFELAFNSEFILTYLVLFAGTFLMLRRWNLVRAAALMGALIFTFGGFNVLHFGQMHAIAVVAHIPWLLLACDVLICSKDFKTLAISQLAVSLLTASELLLGYPQFVVFSLIAQGAWVLWRVGSSGGWRRLPLLVVAIVLGFVIGAIQLLPTWDLVSLSDRASTSLEFRTQYSMHPLNVIQLWAPFVLRERYYATARNVDANIHEMAFYTGAFATVALAWLAIRWRRLARDRGFVLATFLFAVFMLIMAFGKYGLIYPWISELPLLRLFPLRCPTRYGLFVHLSMAILAAYAIADMLAIQRQKERIAWPKLWPLAIPLLLSLATAAAACWILYRPNHPWARALSSAGNAIVGCVLISATIGLVAAAARGRRWGLYGIVLVTFAEITLFGIWQHVWFFKPLTMSEIREAIVPMLPPKAGRVCIVGDVPRQNMLILEGYDLMWGYTAMYPAKKPVLDSTSLRLASVHWVMPNVSKIEWFAVPDPLPRARLVNQAIVSDDKANAVRTIEVATTAIVDRPITLDPGKPGDATITTDRPGLLEIATVAPGRQLLVVSERYHTGWQATVDGQPATVMRAYGEYLACVVPEGTHRITMWFEPASYLWGRRITLVGLAATFLLAGVIWLCGQRGRGQNVES